MAQPQSVETAAQVRQRLAEGKQKLLWEAAVNEFKREQLAEGLAKAKDLDEFVKSVDTVNTAREVCEELEKDADKEYMHKTIKINGKVIASGKFVKSTLESIDTFIQLGNVACKAGSDAMSVAWASVSFVLKIIQADYANCERWAEAASIMARILCTCQTLARTYNTSRIGADGSQLKDESVTNLLNLIPATYKAILSFSWAAKVQLQHRKLHRLFSQVNPWSGLANASTAAFKTIKENDRLMREYSQDAFHLISVEAQNLQLDGQDGMKAGIDELIEINKKNLSSQNEVAEQIDKLRREIKEIKNLPSPEEVERKRFQENKTLLAPSKHSLDLLKRKLKTKQPGTCEWIFKKDTQEFTTWQNSSENSLLWIHGDAGYGKSVLMSTIIDEIQNTKLQTLETSIQDEDQATNESGDIVQKEGSGATHQRLSMNADFQAPLVPFFFCQKSGDNEGTSSAIRLRQDIVYRIYESLYSDDDKLAQANRVFTRGGKRAKEPDSQQDSIEPRAQQSRQAQQALRMTEEKLPDMDDAFVELVRILSRPIVIVIDALDECTDLVSEKLLSSIKQWLEVTDIKVKIIVSSRPEILVQGDIFASFLKIDIQHYNRKDIKKKTNGELRGIRNLRSADRKMVRDKIVQKARNQFTYVDIAIGFLKQPWQYPLENVLNKLAENVQRMNQEYLRSTDPSYLEVAQLALRWTLLRKGNITVDELYDVYSQRFTEGTFGSGRELQDLKEDLKEQNMTDKNDSSQSETESEEDTPNGSNDWAPGQLFEDQIKRAARNLVIVQGEDKHLEYYHHTIKETFLSLSSLMPPPRAEIANGAEVCLNCKGHMHFNDTTHDFFVYPQDHLDIAIVLMRHLRSPKFQDEYCKNTANLLRGLRSHFLESADEEASDEENTENEDDVQIPKSETSEEPEESDEEGSRETEASTVGSNETSPGENSTDETITNGRSTNEAIGDDEYDYFDHCSEDADDDFTGNLGKVQDPGSQEVRYEISALPWHIKQAEKAAGGDLNQFGEKYEQFWAELHAFFEDNVAFYWWRGSYDQSEVDDFDKYELGLRPIHVASEFGWTSIARRLIDKCTDSITNFSDDFAPPLFYFPYNETMNSDLDLLDLLLANTDVPKNVEGDIDYVFLWFFHHSPSNDVVTRLIEWFKVKLGRDCNATVGGQNALHYTALSKAQRGVVKSLVDAGVDINALDDDQLSPLHILLNSINVDSQTFEDFLANGAKPTTESGDSQQPLVGAARNGEVEIARKLIEAKAEVNDLDKDGRIALHAAAISGKHEVVALLLESSSEINRPANDGVTPFFAACASGSEYAAQLIFDRLKDLPIEEIDYPTRLNKTPFRKACQTGCANIVVQMLDLPEFVSERLHTADVVRGWTPLHIAALSARKEVVKILLERGADHERKDRIGKTALQICRERWGESTNEDFEEVINYLIDADIDAARLDLALLYTASSKGCAKIVAKLLEIGAQRSTEDKHGWTARTYARSRGHSHIVNLLDQGGVVGHRPTTLSIGRNTPHVHLSGNVVTLDKEAKSGCGLLADHPIPAGIDAYYFEISVIDGNCAIGFSSYHEGTVNWMPGSSRGGVRSCGYHGVDGAVHISGRGSKDGILLPYGEGDTIGAIFQEKQNLVLFTSSNDMSKYPFQLLPSHGPVFPAVGLAAGGATIKFNFGQEAFELPPGLDFEPLDLNVVKGDASLEWSSDVIKRHDDDAMRFVTEENSPEATVLFYESPLPRTGEEFYFEIMIHDAARDGSVAIGISSYVSKTDGWFVGWRKPGIKTWGYHGDDGAVYITQSSYEAPDNSFEFPLYSAGNTVGCGANLAKDSLFFTKDGQVVGELPLNLSGLSNNMRIFPGISMVGKADIKVNFGNKPFEYQAVE